MTPERLAQIERNADDQDYTNIVGLADDLLELVAAFRVLEEERDRFAAGLGFLFEKVDPKNLEGTGLEFDLSTTLQVDIQLILDGSIDARIGHRGWNTNDTT